MLGYEAVYLNDSSDHDLLSIAKRDSLVLLTSDEELYRTAAMRGIETLLVQGRTEPERLAGLAERYDLKLEIDTTISKCPICGFPIKEVPRDDVESSVPPTTFKVYKSFWVCTNPKCAKVYWQGSHWKKIEQTLESARKILDTSRNTTAGRKQADPRRGRIADPHGAPRSH
jgi:uncharacterized protein with PIN domain